VAVNDVRRGGAESARELTRGGGKAKFYRGDVSDVNAVNRMVAKVEKELRPIDILVNNAGINLGRKRYPVHEFPDGDWHRIVRVDLDGVFYCSRAVSARMVKRKRGVIINIGSIAGVVPLRLQSVFDAVKAGVHNFTRCHALEVGPHGIRVNAIAPGSIVTAGTKRLFYSPARRRLAKSLLSHVPLGRPGEVEEIAAAALYLASDDAAYVTGHVLVVDGGWTAGFTRDW